jgi:DNA-binding NarL/FixJ family response regulator
MQQDAAPNVPTARLRVLVADDSPAVLRSLCAWLETQPRLQVIGVAHNGQDAIRSASLSRPDLVLMDLEMPVMSGLHATEALKRSFPDIKVVVISTHASDTWSATSLKCGAEAFVAKQRIPQDLPPLVERLFPPNLAAPPVNACGTCATGTLGAQPSPPPATQA